MNPFRGVGRELHRTVLIAAATYRCKRAERYDRLAAREWSRLEQQVANIPPSLILKTDR